MTNISDTGLGLNLEEFLSRGVVVDIELKTYVQSLQGLLVEERLNSISVQVHWTQAVGGRYLHGCQINGLSESRRKRLFHAVEATTNSLKVDEASSLRLFKTG